MALPHCADASALCRTGLFGWYTVWKRKQYRDGLPVAVWVHVCPVSSFMIGYYFNLMWLDSIVMLPLVMLRN